MTEIIVHGKSGGRFQVENGNFVNTYKVSAAIPTDQLDGDWQVVGAKCLELKVSESVFRSLPNDPVAYDGGMVCLCEFDFKGRVVSLETA